MQTYIKPFQCRLHTSVPCLYIGENRLSWDQLFLYGKPTASFSFFLFMRSRKPECVAIFKIHTGVPLANGL